MLPEGQALHVLASGEKTVPRQSLEHNSSVYAPGCILHQYPALLPGLMSSPETLHLGALSSVHVRNCQIVLPVSCMSSWNTQKLTFPFKSDSSQSQLVKMTKSEGSFQILLREDSNFPSFLPFLPSPLPLSTQRCSQGPGSFLTPSTKSVVSNLSLPFISDTITLVQTHPWDCEV